MASHIPFWPQEAYSAIFRLKPWILCWKKNGANALRWLASNTAAPPIRSEEHTSELQSLMRISYAVFCLKKKTKTSAPYNQSALHSKKHTQSILHEQHTDKTQ